MRLHFLQHVWFEDLAYIKTWAERRNIIISRTAFFNNEALPAIDSFDRLVVMGGPMGVYEEKEYLWLVDEKKFIDQAIRNGKKVLGICLGAQLIAAAAGADVYKQSHPEIGWFDVFQTEQGKASEVFSALPDAFEAFHWHSDTFDLPRGAKRLAESGACKNQAFELNGNVVGLQFHLESTVESINNLIKNSGSGLEEKDFVQSRDTIESECGEVKFINQLMDILLERFFYRAG